MMRRTLVLGAIIILVASCKNSSDLPSPASLSVAPPQKNYTPDPSRPARWNLNALPLNVKVSEDFSQFEIGLLEDMALEWDVAADQLLEFFQVPFQTTRNLEYENLISYKDDEYGIYRSYNWFSELGSHVLAVTQFFGYPQGDYIDLIHGDIIFNYRDHEFTSNLEDNTYDLASVALHEMGHLLGLFHVFDFFNDTVMFPTLAKSTAKRSTFSLDRENIQDNYQLSVTQNSEGTPHSTYQGSVYSRSSGERPTEGELVRGVIELRENGECQHYLNGILQYVHFQF